MNFSIKKFLGNLNSKSLFEFLESKKALWVCVAVALGLTLIWGNNKSHTSEEVKADRNVDTFIPAGFVLVPIEVQNYEALDSILGSHGFVDLFLPGKDGSKKGIRVASHVRILRAPLNPSQFAVLVRDNDSEKLVRSDSPFFVVVQNSKESGTGFVSEDPVASKKHISRVVLEGE